MLIYRMIQIVAVLFWLKHVMQMCHVHLPATLYAGYHQVITINTTTKLCEQFFLKTCKETHLCLVFFHHHLHCLDAIVFSHSVRGMMELYDHDRWWVPSSLFMLLSVLLMAMASFTILVNLSVSLCTTSTFSQTS